MPEQSFSNFNKLDRLVWIVIRPCIPQINVSYTIDTHFLICVSLELKAPFFLGLLSATL